MSETFCKKISLSKIGNTYTKGKTISEDHKKSVSRHSKGNKYCLNRILSEETKAKIGDANRGKIRKEPWKCSLPGNKNGMYGKKHTEESKEKNRLAQKRKSVIKKSKTGDFIDKYDSLSEAALFNNIKLSGISACCRKSKKFPSYKGYIWEYV